MLWFEDNQKSDISPVLLPVHANFQKKFKTIPENSEKFQKNPENAGKLKVFTDDCGCLIVAKVCFPDTGYQVPVWVPGAGRANFAKSLCFSLGRNSPPEQCSGPAGLGGGGA